MGITATLSSMPTSSRTVCRHIIPTVLQEKTIVLLLIFDILPSTGASQFDTLEALTKEDGIAWDKVEMFHLDEYVDLPETHPASASRWERAGSLPLTTYRSRRSP